MYKCEVIGMGELCYVDLLLCVCVCVCVWGGGGGGGGGGQMCSPEYKQFQFHCQTL